MHNSFVALLTVVHPCVFYLPYGPVRRLISRFLSGGGVTAGRARHIRCVNPARWYPESLKREAGPPVRVVVRLDRAIGLVIVLLPMARSNWAMPG
jgi:hypothetical protein